jgi:3-hydroxybutyryl-CoA dehydratase
MDYNDFVIGYSGAFTRPVSKEDNLAFAELSGDFNPVHFDDGAARDVGFAGAISNGFVTESRIPSARSKTWWWRWRRTRAS